MLQLLGLRLVALQAASEPADALSDGLAQRRQTLGAEQQHDDRQDDQQFRPADGTHVALSRRGCVSRGVCATCRACSTGPKPSGRGSIRAAGRAAYSVDAQRFEARDQEGSQATRVVQAEPVLVRQIGVSHQGQRLVCCAERLLVAGGAPEDLL